MKKTIFKKHTVYVSLDGRVFLGGDLLEITGKLSEKERSKLLEKVESEYGK